MLGWGGVIIPAIIIVAGTELSAIWILTHFVFPALPFTVCDLGWLYNFSGSPSPLTQWDHCSCLWVWCEVMYTEHLWPRQAQSPESLKPSTSYLEGQVWAMSPLSWSSIAQRSKQALPLFSNYVAGTFLPRPPFSSPLSWIIFNSWETRKGRMPFDQIHRPLTFLALLFPRFWPTPL